MASIATRGLKASQAQLQEELEEARAVQVATRVHIAADIPLMDGSGAAGSTGQASDAGHVHPSDTSREVALGSPAADGYLLASTAAGVRSWVAPYAHPTGDGNLHVPATGTSSSGLVLTAGATAGSASWQTPTCAWSNVTGRPTALSAFTNDAGFITSAAVPTAYAGTPAMNGAGSAGTSTNWAKGDHVHPSDASREPVLGNPGTSGYVLASTAAGVRSWVPNGVDLTQPGPIGGAVPNTVKGTTITATAQFSGPGTGLTNLQASSITNASAGITDTQPGSSWVSQLTDGTVMIRESNTIGAGNSYRAFIQSRNSGYTYTLGRLSNSAIGFYGFVNTRTQNGTDFSCYMDNAGSWNVSGNVNAAQFNGSGAGLNGAAWSLTVGRSSSAGSVDTIRAWCYATGFNSPGIRAGSNVSSISVNGNGNYTFNFATALPDANYVTSIMEVTGTWSVYDFLHVQSQTASAVQIDVQGSGGNSCTPPSLQIICFR